MSKTRQPRFVMPTRLLSLFGIVAVVSAGWGTETLHWPHWRGPLGNGVVEEGNPPITWSATENVRWIANLPGTGASTPIIVGDRLFVLSAEATDEAPGERTPTHPDARTEPPQRYYRFWLLALDRHSGETLWRREVVKAVPHEGHHRTNTYAGGSPVADAERLYVSLGSRGVYAFSFDGKELWRRELGRIRTRRGWGEASTPAVREGILVIPWDQEDQSALFGLNAATGETKWEVRRDEPSNWSTPVFTTQPGGTQVVLNGTQRARGYDLATGRSVWACGELSVNAIPTPVFDDSLIFCMSGYRKSVIYAIPRSAQGDLTASDRIAWTFERHTPYVASPLLYRGRLVFTKGLGSRISILDSATGQPFVEAEPLRGLANVYASPVGVDGRIYITDREGTTVVLAAGDELKILATNRLDDTTDASPVVVGKRLYIRSWSAVYCLENQAP